MESPVIPNNPDSLIYTPSHSEDATVPFPSWGADWNREYLVPLRQSTMPIDWLQQVSTTCPSDIDMLQSGTIPSFILAAEGCLSPLPEWLEWPGPGYGLGIFETNMSQLAPKPLATADNIDGQATVESSNFEADFSRYPPTPLEPVSISSQDGAAPSPQNHPPDDLTRQPREPHQIRRRQNSGTGKRGPEEPGKDPILRPSKKKRGRPPIQTTDLPAYLPSPVTSTHTPVSPESTTRSLHNSSNKAQLSTTMGIPLPRLPAACLSPDCPKLPESPPSLATTAATTPTARPPTPRTPHPTIANHITTCSTSIHNLTTTPDPPPEGPETKPSLKTRNRLAASRYRAKTQARSSELQASERTARARRASLLACRDALRDEVFALKNELLRHAAEAVAGSGCECDIRGVIESVHAQGVTGAKIEGKRERGS